MAQRSLASSASAEEPDPTARPVLRRRLRRRGRPPHPRDSDLRRSPLGLVHRVLGRRRRM